MPSSVTTTTTTTSKRHAAPWSAFDKVFNDAFPEPKRHRRRASTSSDLEPVTSNALGLGRASSPPPLPSSLLSSSLPTVQPAPTVPRRDRGYKLASERKRTSVKDVPSGQWKDLPGGGEWTEARHDWDEERTREQKFTSGYPVEVPQFEQKERKAVRKTTGGSSSGHGHGQHENGNGNGHTNGHGHGQHASAGPTPQKPSGHHRNESWSSMSSAGDGKPKKPRVTFTDSQDGRMRSAKFELPGIAKEDINVSFQVDQIVVTWQTVKETEEQIGDQLIRERKEKKYTRSLPLSTNTDFAQVKATMEGPYLTIHYPNAHAHRNRTHKDVHIH